MSKAKLLLFVFVGSALTASVFQNCSNQIQSNNSSEANPASMVTTFEGLEQNSVSPVAVPPSFAGSQAPATGQSNAQITGVPASNNQGEGIFLSVNNQPSNGPFPAGVISVKIVGFDANDIQVCADSNFNSAAIGCQYGNFAKLPVTGLGLQKFTFQQGVWRGEFVAGQIWQTYRLTVRNSSGKTFSKKFESQGYPGHDMGWARTFVSGKESTTVEHKPDTLVELRVYGFQENDIYFCRSDAEIRTGGALYYKKNCTEKDIVKLVNGQDGWTYKNGIWVTTVNTSSLTLDDYYLYAFVAKSHKTLATANIISTNRIAEGFVVGANYQPSSTTNSAGTTLSACSNWEVQEVKTCAGGTEYGRVAGCLPPLYDNPLYWKKETDGSFTHRTGRSCATITGSTNATLPACSNWEAQEVKTCSSGIEYGRVTGCLPPLYDNPLYWKLETDGSFTHRTGRTCSH